MTIFFGGLAATAGKGRPKAAAGKASEVKKKGGKAAASQAPPEDLAAVGAEAVEEVGSESGELAGEEAEEGAQDTASQPLKSAILKASGAKQKPGKVEPCSTCRPFMWYRTAFNHDSIQQFHAAVSS